MHVLQLGPFPPPEGGVNRNLMAIREELLDSGHQCSVIAIMRSSKIVPTENVYHPRGAAELLRLLFRLKYDVLHLHIGGDLPLRLLGLVGVCAFLGRGKTVLTFHSGGYPLSDAGRSARRFSLRGFIFRRFDRIIAVNRLIAEMFERFGVKKENLRIILPFVHRSPDKRVEVPENLRQFAEKHRPLLLTVCLLDPAYDPIRQIDALEQVLEKFPEAGLLIVGGGDMKDELKRIIAGKSYGERIYLAGNVEHAVTLHLINDCDLLLRTTLFDGDAIAIREALHLETPVIATDNGMRPAGVHLIPIKDGGELAPAIIGVLGEAERKTKTPKPDDRSNVVAVLDLYREILK
ncbi:MAG: glycosyltransferase family 4 protein [Pyrinomonadaceae bacterium]